MAATTEQKIERYPQLVMLLLQVMTSDEAAIKEMQAMGVPIPPQAYEFSRLIRATLTNMDEL